MHQHRLEDWQHSHSFGQERRRAGENRTRFVVLLNLGMMAAEIAAGLAFGSMALLADGLHMASHTVALGMSVFAYVYARRHATNPAFSFGTGKVNALAGFTSAVLLGAIGVLMVVGGLERLANPVAIAFDEALLVATVGLAVNGLAAALLNAPETPAHSHANDHTHHHAHGPGRGRDEGHAPDRSAERHAPPDHNLRAAYLHVVTDALTSLFAIASLLAAKFLGWNWVDPLMAMLGSLLVTHWSVGMLRATAAVLLDRQAPEAVRERCRAALQGMDDTEVTDLHVWAIGPGIYAAAVALVTHRPLPVADYKRAIPDSLGIVHATIEVDRCPGDEPCL